MEYKYNGHYYARPCRQTTILTPENIVIKAAQIIWLYQLMLHNNYDITQNQRYFYLEIEK